MTRKSISPFATYSFHKPQIFNLLYDELGQAVVRLHNEQFAGTPIADTTEYKPNQPIRFSNVPRALSYNQILYKLTNGRIQVASPVDVVQYFDSIPERDTTIADTNAITFFSKEGKNKNLAARVLDLLGKSRSQVISPFFVTGLGVKKASKGHDEFTFVETELQQVIEAPYLTKETRVRYDSKTRTLVETQDNEKGVKVFVPGDQSGLRRAFRGRNVLGCEEQWLLFSVAHGRVQVVQRDRRVAPKN
ncbi:hypothetical protein J4208_04485 [Candidatus Woesearchaeota archaeon]|nr:hypothetical protein [Candidatus Woesearchaeota archaeon]